MIRNTCKQTAYSKSLATSSQDLETLLLFSEDCLSLWAFEQPEFADTQLPV